MTHGGARTGAGRKAKKPEERRQKICLSVSPDKLMLIKQMARESGKTLSKFILDKVLG